MDKSSFIHHGTGIPIEIREYFELHDIVKGYQYPVDLVYQDKVFQAVISADNQPNPRTRLFWHEDFASVIHSIMPSWYQYFLSNSDSSESPRCILYNCNFIISANFHETWEPFVSCHMYELYDNLTLFNIDLYYRILPEM